MSSHWAKLFLPLQIQCVSNWIHRLGHCHICILCSFCTSPNSYILFVYSFRRGKLTFWCLTFIIFNNCVPIFRDGEEKRLRVGFWFPRRQCAALAVGTTWNWIYYACVGTTKELVKSCCWVLIHFFFLWILMFLYIEAWVKICIEFANSNVLYLLLNGVDYLLHLCFEMCIVWCSVVFLLH